MWPPRASTGWLCWLGDRQPSSANHLRFLILPGWHQPNLASRLLALNLKRLSADWEGFYGHPILVAETFVDSTRFQGTCYRAAGWKVLGTTRGFAKRGRGYVPHGQPKTVLVRPLTARSVSQLGAPFLPACTTRRKENELMVDVNCLPLESQGGLIDLLRILV